MTQLFDAPICFNDCSNEGTPVCGQDFTGKYLYFTNQCQFEVERCNSPFRFWKIVQTHLCRQHNLCKNVCTGINGPVCGRSQQLELREFASMCILMLENCKSPHQQWRPYADRLCPGKNQNPFTSNQKCVTVCDGPENHVCGLDRQLNQKTFVNKCELKFSECETPKGDWQLQRRSDCFP